MAKKKTLPKTLKQKLELLDELTNHDIDQYILITSRGEGKSFKHIQHLTEEFISMGGEIEDYYE